VCAAGYTEEEALNELDIMDICCRIAMKCPTIVHFDVENRLVIEGFKSVDAAVDDDQNMFVDLSSPAIFSACLVPPVQSAPRLPSSSSRASIFGQRSRRNTPIAASSTTATEEEPSNNRPIISPIDMDVHFGVENEPLGEAIDLGVANRQEYIVPTTVGLPTINPDPTIPDLIIPVGAGKQTRILGGRTYLAR